MPRYLIEASASPQTIAALVKNPTDRAEAARLNFEKLGGRLEAYFFGVGNGKHYVVVEFDRELDAITIEALWLSVWASGALTSQSITQLLTAAEMVDALRRAGDMGYRPPS